MGFFKELTAELDRVPAMRRGPGRADVSEVLKYAPLRLRPRREDRLDRLEAETNYWRERAGQAEGRVRFLETSIQRIATGGRRDS
jgi:hypothetical protein